MDKTKQQDQVQMNIVMDPIKTPVLYADAIMITSNENGIVLDITQRMGLSNQASIVARIGMSNVHAKVLATKLLEQISLNEGSAVTGKIKIHN